MDPYEDSGAGFELGFVSGFISGARIMDSYHGCVLGFRCRIRIRIRFRVHIRGSHHGFVSWMRIRTQVQDSN